MTKTILIIEDDLRIAQNIYKVLHSEGFGAEISRDGLSGKKMALEGRYDLVLLDVNLPGLNGFEVCRQIGQFKPLLPVIMLTAYGEVEGKVEGLGKGATDYIVKPFDFRELIARINAALRLSDAGMPETGRRVLSIADLQLNVDTKVVTRGGKFIGLTAKEFALLEYFLLHPGMVISKMDLARNIWHLNFDPGTNFVEVYINYLRKKIDRGFDVKLIQTRPGLGYILMEG
ncbi:response regulator transcription factor [Dyadobacter sp. 676]|uniref:Response regulator transcription factor n=1 Tax=Dyadobacter sp. 676 TaxID=3088362 RepID=A0AAU8FMG3_9BACT